MATLKIQDLPIVVNLEKSELRNFRGGVIGDCGYPKLSLVSTLPLRIPSPRRATPIRLTYRLSPFFGRDLCSAIPINIP